MAGFLQIDVKLGRPDKNIEQVRKGLADLAPRRPGIIVLPELWATGFAYDTLNTLAAETPAILSEVQGLAAKHSILIAGSLPEKEESTEGVNIYNTMYVSGPAGTQGKFRKQQLFSPMDEDLHFAAGIDPRPIETDLGRMASLVCYDLRFPELAKRQTVLGAGMLLVSAQWPAARTEHWQALLRARAIENQIFVVACNRCGTTGDTAFAGHSMILAPDGTVLAEASEGPESCMIPIDPALLKEARARFNTAVITPYRFHDQEKIMELSDLQDEIAQQKRLGRKIVFTNGCFDILHKGHVSYLEEARRQGDCLVVGLNSDVSVKSIKGPDRPINNQGSRARVLAALGCIDYVVLFDEDTPLNLIKSLNPDVLAKGADWPIDKIVGAKEVLAAGGKVVNISLVDDFSTSSVITKIQKQK